MCITACSWSLSPSCHWVRLPGLRGSPAAGYSLLGTPHLREFDARLFRQNFCVCSGDCGFCLHWAVITFFLYSGLQLPSVQRQQHSEQYTFVTPTDLSEIINKLLQLKWWQVTIQLPFMKQLQLCPRPQLEGEARRGSSWRRWHGAASSPQSRSSHPTPTSRSSNLSSLWRRRSSSNSTCYELRYDVLKLWLCDIRYLALYKKSRQASSQRLSKCSTKYRLPFKYFVQVTISYWKLTLSIMMM